MNQFLKKKKLKDKFNFKVTFLIINHLFDFKVTLKLLILKSIKIDNLFIFSHISPGFTHKL